MEDKPKGKPGPEPEKLKVDLPLKEALRRLVTPRDEGAKSGGVRRKMPT